MQENKGIKKYVLTRQAHFGYTKQSYVGGTVFTVDFDKGKYTANGSTYEDLRDINIAVRAGFMDAFSEATQKKVEKSIKKQNEIREKITESKKEKPKKMEIIKSDEDLIDPIPIESAKKESEKDNSNDKMEIIKENSDDTARGMTVLRSQSEDMAESSQGTVVSVIGGGDKTNVKTAKENKPTKKRTKASEEKALKTAEKRKQDALNKRKAKENKEEK